MRAHNYPIYQLLLATFVFTFLFTGCVRRGGDTNPALAGSETSPAYGGPGEKAVPPGNISKRYYRSANGQMYYVDDQGAVHTIARSGVVTTYSGDTTVYYIEGDERPFYPDETGRLYYRVPQGGIYYLDDTGPGKVIDPLPILRGTEFAPAIESGRSQTYCSSQWKKCSSQCSDLSREADRRACMDNCDIERGNCERSY